MESEEATVRAPDDGEGRSDRLRQALAEFEVPLIRYALTLTGDIETARDVVQDTFLRLHEQPPGTVDGHLAPWLFTVCRNRARDVQRKASRMTVLTETDLEHRPAPGPSPAESAASSDSSARITELLAGLPLNQREVVRLKFQHHLSYQEIAAVTELSVGNVGFLLHTALKSLRAQMERIERPHSAAAAH